MNQGQKLKTKFRASKKWKDFRHSKYVEQGGKCPVCGMKLGKTANLHHIDLRAENYQDLSNSNNFVFLCRTCHEFIHYKLKSYIRKDFNVQALIGIWDRMREVNAL